MGMLVLSRKVGERIVVVDDLTGDVLFRLMITDVCGPRAKIGIEAPRRFRFVREEIFEDIQPSGEWVGT